MTDDNQTPDQPKPKKPRGFGALSPEEKRRISQLGGRKAHERGTAHRWTSDEAAVAGRAGGKASHKKKAKNEE